VAVITVMQRYIQLPQESVRAHANCLIANWRQAGWNLQKHEEVLYEIAWASIYNSLKNTVGPMMPACGRFDTFDEFFDMAAASEVTHVEHKSHIITNSCSNNCSRNSLRTHLAKAANEATGHRAPSQATSPGANQANQDQTDTANQVVEENCHTYRQYHWSQRKFL